MTILGLVVVPAPRATATVLISEMQTGNVARADEFIELHNTGDQPIDLTGWQLRYITAEVASVKTPQDPTAVIRLAPSALLPAKGYYLLHAGSSTLPAGVIGQLYEALLPATGGSLVLLNPDQATCQLITEDAVAWGATDHLFGEGQALPAGQASAEDRLNQRYLDASGLYQDTGVNAVDFLASPAAILPPLASPGAPNTQLLPELPVAGSGKASQPLPLRITNPDCAPPPAVEPPPITPSPTSPPSIPEPPAKEPEVTPAATIPPGNAGLMAPLLSEFLPNPAPPATDKKDEFIELYNANDASFDLSGYALAVGPTAKRRYTIPAGTELEPGTFMAFFSASTKLALANGSSQVRLFDPLGRELVVSDAYRAAKEGQAWVLADGKWRWTVKPTPGALNVISAPASKKVAKKNTKAATITVRTTAAKGETVASRDVAEADQHAAAAATTTSPLHPGVLALIAASALLYGAYEYRHDLANKFYQFRSHRAARRAARQGAEGR